MTFPVPVPGLVIRYSYLWRHEQSQGREEGIKDRPCAVLLSVRDKAGERKVVALPITHTPPRDPAHGVEIPAATKQRLGLDNARSWIVISESNRFIWPGPDLRFARNGDQASVVHGELPAALFEIVRAKWLALFRASKTHIISRSE